ncbi:MULTISPECIES: response regulator transcription factor [unclassified Streptosporangium]|jgi:DNA-binding response OmpR family regulator|uniref:response regulator transcription factor n=1 Tax=unclassified Streptosporangium TaxID=2632669 RepID=UPI002DDB8EB7|nr:MULTISPECIES: response regulator transcription factor [unclassified Streptosporangium]WSA23994.1 response regulator transcription factor [Streptosporangium sp. NBC_01810]WSC97930.1 response regulator transcription factor [Streptosporangium sp. NBC_01755]
MATPQQRRVLVVEDDETIARAVRHRLAAEGFDVLVVGDGEAALVAYAKTGPDVVVLDRLLPGLDGLEVCRRMQAARPVPVLMLTALGEETDLLVGLGVGADDYMAKPFSMRELVARVHALLRRVERASQLAVADTVIRVADVEIDTAERRVYVRGDEAQLTRTEFDLLCRLAERPGQVFERERLLADIWGFSEAAATRTVDSHVRALRRKLGPGVVRTVHGVGYALVRQ